MQPTQMTSPNYPHPLRYWDGKSWIRSKPIRDNSMEGLPFPLELVSLASHPTIAENTALQRKVLAYRLLQHLKFTTVLELEHVNPVCSQIGRGESLVELNLDSRNDALRIYCDEGGHALFVELLSKAVELRYGIDSSILGEPFFSTEMNRILAEEKTEHRTLFQQVFVAVSETLVTKILRDIPHHTEVAPAVREVIGDHASDEATHSVYFRWYFQALWKAMDPALQLKVGLRLPELVWTFLGPDQSVERRTLLALGFNSEETKSILEEVHQPLEVLERVRDAAKPTLEMFRQAGVMEIPQVKDAFSKQGLVT